MKKSRRTFIRSSAALATTFVLPSCVSNTKEAKDSSLAPTNVNAENSKDKIYEKFDPWIEVLPEAIKHNVKTLYKLSGNRPIMAVVKNNGYGLGDVNVAQIMEPMDEVVGFAAVKTEACLALRKAGIMKPILHIGMATDSDFLELVANDIQLAIYNEGMHKVLDEISLKVGNPVKVHLYIDTGMSRMGIPYHKALPWIEDISTSKNIEILGAFMGFTEDPDYDKVQLERLKELNEQAAKKGIVLGKLHAASSNAIYHFPESALDMVRPGISLYGAYPTYPEKEKNIAELKVAYNFKARIVRVEELRTGDSVSYGRNYIADKPVWIATIPIGHADGYLRNAVKGAKVLVNGNLYPVIGAVSASHTIIEIGDKKEVSVGDIAILEGADHPEIHPSHISTITGDSVYDVLMHLSSRLPKIIT
ncbi:MAG: alanine racemase [Cellulophaga sp.]